MKKYCILIILVVIFITIDCSSQGRDFPIAKINFQAGKAQLTAYPDEISTKISETDLTGSVVIKNAMGITLTGFSLLPLLG